MSKEKQIEEMALAICNSRGVADVDDCRTCWKYENGCLYQEIAYGLYNAGYRKQSENTVEVVRCWECRQYEANILGDGIGYCNEYGMKMLKNDYCSYGSKMKGGAE